MKTTTAWAIRPRMRQLVSKLHPPTAPTSSENAQLLRSLQSSFRHELDERHPQPTNAAINANLDESISNALPASASATTSHVASILSNPLFNRTPPPQDSPTARLNQLQSSLAQSHILSPSEAASHVTSALQVFLRASLNDDQRAAASQAARDTLEWFKTATQPHRRAFFAGGVMTKHIIPLLNASRNESVAWEWLKIIYERKLIDLPLSNFAALQVEDKLVAALMLMSTWRGDLNEAAQQFLHASTYHNRSGRAVEHGHRSASYVPLRNSWSLLANAVVLRRHNHGIDPATFTSYLNCSPAGSEHARVTRELLLVYHPVTPTAHELVESLKSSYEAFQSNQASARDRARKSIMIALLDSAQLSLQQGFSSEARYLLDTALDTYPEWLPRPPVDRVHETEPLLERSFALALG